MCWRLLLFFWSMARQTQKRSGRILTKNLLEIYRSRSFVPRRRRRTFWLNSSARLSSSSTHTPGRYRETSIRYMCRPKRLFNAACERSVRLCFAFTCEAFVGRLVIARCANVTLISDNSDGTFTHAWLKESIRRTNWLRCSIVKKLTTTL